MIPPLISLLFDLCKTLAAGTQRPFEHIAQIKKALGAFAGAFLIFYGELCGSLSGHRDESARLNYSLYIKTE